METVKIGINGFGRIGRLVLRASLLFPGLEVVAVNTRAQDLSYLAYLCKYDTTHGYWDAEVTATEEGLLVNGKLVKFSASHDPAEIPWSASGAQYIVDCTGKFNKTELASAHLKGGAKKVILSAPAKDDVTPTFVMGVNSDDYKKEMTVVSSASCTTNCLAPLAKVLNDKFGIESGLMTTVHAVTSTQLPVDGTSKKDWRGGRAAYNNIIPSTTGAAKAVGLVIPDLAGKLTGMSLRVPVINGSVVDLTVNLKTPTTYKEICAAVKEASEGYMKGCIAYTEDAIVSSDVIGQSCPSLFDAGAGIMMTPTFAKVMTWYDNEWGFTHAMMRLIRHMAEVDQA